MKIYSTYTNNQFREKRCFKGNNDWNIIGFDEAGKPIRDYIRLWREQNIMPYQSIYEQEPRLDEYQLNKLIGFL